MSITQRGPGVERVQAEARRDVRRYTPHEAEAAQRAGLPLHRGPADVRH